MATRFDDGVHQPVRDRLCGREDSVALGLGTESTCSLARVRGEQFLDLVPDAHEFVCLDDQVRNRALAPNRRLVQDHRRMGRINLLPGAPAASRAAPTPMACPTRTAQSGTRSCPGRAPMAVNAVGRLARASAAGDSPAYLRTSRQRWL